MEAQQAGKIRSIGVSNYGVHHLDELEEHIRSTGYGSKIDVGQYELHPWCDRREIVSWLQKRNIVVEAYSPMAHGTRMNEPLLRSLGKKYGKTPAQIMIRWGVQNVSIYVYFYYMLGANCIRASFLFPNPQHPSGSRKMPISLILSCRMMR